MKNQVICATFFCFVLIACAFVREQLAPPKVSPTFEEFVALFPETDFPVVADSTFLKNAKQKERTIDKQKFKKFISGMNQQDWFSRSPAVRNFYAVAKINQTKKYIAFAYLKSERVHLGNYNNLGLHILTFNENGKKMDDITVAKLIWEGTGKYYKLILYQQATIKAEPKSIFNKNTFQKNKADESALIISKKGFVEKPIILQKK